MYRYFAGRIEITYLLFRQDAGEFLQKNLKQGFVCSHEGMNSALKQYGPMKQPEQERMFCISYN